MSTLAIAAACIALSGAHITAGDLAKALTAFVPADPAAVLSPAPAPGIARVFHPAELERLLASMSVPATAPLTDICFERFIAPLSGAAVLEAMRAALVTAATIELIEVSHFPAPDGEIVFPRGSLGLSGSSNGALWRGFVRYDDGRKFQIWARVKIRMPVTRMIAVETLQQGQPIRSAQVKLETVDDAPNRYATPQTLENVEGFIPRRTISADSPVRADSIDPPMEIVKGDRVTVRVHSGLAELTFNVEATTSGRRGEGISLKNPGSGRTFRARIDGPKEASVQTDLVKP
jgi:flagella basal body P-ring formation protein FlgA